jgi:hypothetical protein
VTRSFVIMMFFLVVVVITASGSVVHVVRRPNM